MAAVSTKVLSELLEHDARAVPQRASPCGKAMVPTHPTLPRDTFARQEGSQGLRPSSPPLVWGAGPPLRTKPKCSSGWRQLPPPPVPCPGHNPGPCRIWKRSRAGELGRSPPATAPVLEPPHKSNWSRLSAWLSEHTEGCDSGWGRQPVLRLPGSSESLIPSLGARDAGQAASGRGARTPCTAGLFQPGALCWAPRATLCPFLHPS